MKIKNIFEKTNDDIDKEFIFDGLNNEDTVSKIVWIRSFCNSIMLPVSAITVIMRLRYRQFTRESMKRLKMLYLVTMIVILRI